MRISTRLSVAAAIVIVATTAACGSDSTGPPGGGGSTAGTLAQHFDTLYQHAKASSLGDTNYAARADLISDLELAAAFGATPTSVTVTTAAGTETWKGFVFEELHPDTGSSVDSAYLIVAYRDSLLHTMLFAGFRGNGSSLGTSLIANDTLVINASSHSGGASLTSVGATCATPIAGLANPIIATAQGTACLSAVFSSSVTAAFPAHAGVDAALTAFSYGTTSFAGERFSDSATPGNRVHLSTTLLRRLGANR